MHPKRIAAKIKSSVKEVPVTALIGFVGGGSGYFVGYTGHKLTKLLGYA